MDIQYQKYDGVIARIFSKLHTKYHDEKVIKLYYKNNAHHWLLVKTAQMVAEIYEKEIEIYAMTLKDYLLGKFRYRKYKKIKVKLFATLKNYIGTHPVGWDVLIAALENNSCTVLDDIWKTYYSNTKN